MALTPALLRQQDDQTSRAVIEALESYQAFQTLSSFETEAIMKRDEADGVKLADGIKLAQDKKVLPVLSEPPQYQRIDVQGKSADAVADEIIAVLGSAKDSGCVCIIVGLSGTGKGTTVSKLQQRIPQASAWSNGNLFRCLTLLALEHCKQKGVAEAQLDSELTPENLQAWMGMLEFGQFDGVFDIKITGLGLSGTVSEWATTVLKAAEIGKNIPVVARVTQGEVVSFAATAITTMASAGRVILLEGREQTVDFIPSPFRFCLTLADNSIIGKRQAAMKLSARVAQGLTDTSSHDDIMQALQQAVDAEKAMFTMI